MSWILMLSIWLTVCPNTVSNACSEHIQSDRIEDLFYEAETRDIPLQVILFDDSIDRSEKISEFLKGYLAQLQANLTSYYSHISIVLIKEENKKYLTNWHAESQLLISVIRSSNRESAHLTV